MVNISRRHKDVDPVLLRFMSSVLSKYPKVEVRLVKSVQNQRLYDQYLNAKRSLEKSGQAPKTRFLWHGTTSDATMDTIATQGFRKEFSTTARWGQGTYFAKEASFSVHYSAKCKFKGISSSVYKMFYCQVLCGKSTLG